MKSFILPILVVGVAVSGCATKKYVGKEVGEVNKKVDNVSAELEKTQERVKRNEVRIDEVGQQSQAGITEAKGSDLRCLVIGNQVVAAMRRQAEPGEFRSNLHRGGQGIRVRLSTAERETALRAAQVMGLELAGVDLLRSHKGPLVLEVNSSPGLEGIEGVSGVDVAGAIIDHVCQRVAAGTGNTDRRSAKKNK